jgi:hypothetical protein
LPPQCNLLLQLLCKILLPFHSSCLTYVVSTCTYFGADPNTYCSPYSKY